MPPLKVTIASAETQLAAVRCGYARSMGMVRSRAANAVAHTNNSTTPSTAGRRRRRTMPANIRNMARPIGSDTASASLRRKNNIESITASEATPGDHAPREDTQLTERAGKTPLSLAVRQAVTSVGRPQQFHRVSSGFDVVDFSVLIDHKRHPTRNRVLRNVNAIILRDLAIHEIAQ